MSSSHSSRFLSPKSSPKQKKVVAQPERGWDITPITINHFLEGLEHGEHRLPLDAQFTNLRHANRSSHEIAEIAAATGESNIHKLITYPPHRLALLLTACIVQTEIRLESDEALFKSVQEIYRNTVKPILKENKILQASCELEAKKMALIALDASADTETPYYNIAKELHDTILSRYHAGDYVPHKYFDIYDSGSGELLDSSPEEAVKEIIYRAVSDRIYQVIVYQNIVNIIEPAIDKKIDDKSSPYRRLSQHAGQARHTFMLSGPPACGKGTANALIEIQAEVEYGIAWDNIIKVNTDVYRDIVSSHAITGEEKEISVSLNGTEASAITTMVQERITQKLKVGRVPHVLFDGANPGMDRLEFGTNHDGHMHLVVVTAPVEVSIARAFSRGLETGRYVMTEFMLNSHRTISAELFKRLSSFQGKNLEFVILDTNVDINELPKKIMDGNMKEGVACVFDKDALALFCGKKNIHMAAKSKDELFKLSKDERSQVYLQQIPAAGMKIVEYVDNTAKKTSVDSPRKKFK
jgi:hypothetical protein